MFKILQRIATFQTGIDKFPQQEKPQLLTMGVFSGFPDLKQQQTEYFFRFDNSKVVCAHSSAAGSYQGVLQECVSVR